MAQILWIGVNGDWNDPASWLDGIVPSATDTADFSAGTQVTVGGSAYIGTLSICGASVTLDGDFSGDGTDVALINDGAPSTDGSLTIDSWANVSVDRIDLRQTHLDVQGAFSNASGTLGSGAVNGTSAEWLTTDTRLTGTLAVLNGGCAAGTLELSPGSNVTCDNLSTLQDGTLDVEGNASLDLVESTSPSSDFDVGDAVNISTGTTLSLAAPTATTVTLGSGVSGAGSLDLAGESVVIGSAFALSSQISVVSGSMSAAQMTAGGGAITLTDGLLDLHLDQKIATGAISVICEGTEDTVLAGSGNINLAAEGLSNVSFVGGSGSATLSAEAGGLTVTGGSGSEKVVFGDGGGEAVCGSGNDTIFGHAGAISVVGGAGSDQVWGSTSGHDTIYGGSGSDTLFGGTDAKIYAEGANAAILGTYATVDGALLDASKSSGQDSLFAGGGTGVITMVGGSGSNLIVGSTSVDSITCGPGNTSVYAGSASGDTIVGGLGKDVLVGGPRANISVTGHASDLVVSLGQGTVVNASESSGTDTVFACGTGTTTIACGGGSQCIVGDTSCMSVIGGSGSMAVWGGAGGHDTILGGSGNDTLVASGYSVVTAIGSGNNVLVSQGNGNTLDTRQAAGSNMLFLSGSGSTTVLFGAGENDLVGSGQSADVTYVGGQGSIWAGMGSLDLNVSTLGASGCLDIYQFNEADSTIVLPNSQYQEVTDGGNMQIIFGGETMVLHGITNLGSTSDFIKVAGTT